MKQSIEQKLYISLVNEIEVFFHSEGNEENVRAVRRME